MTLRASRCWYSETDTESTAPFPGTFLFSLPTRSFLSSSDRVLAVSLSCSTTEGIHVGILLVLGLEEEGPASRVLVT